MRKSIAFVVLLFLAVVPAYAQSSGIGFKVKLHDPPIVVAAYQERPDRLSAAILPLSHAYFEPFQKYAPKVEYGRAETNSLTLSTNYYKDLHLVPVSVDAQAYLAHRIEVRKQENRDRNLERSLKEAKEGKRREGLSIGVALPKRFNQMFGEGGANLRVSGYRRITFSGKSQWNDAANSGYTQQSKFPSLNMEQISRFDITGTIGTKISVKVSQDNQTDIPLANRILLRYKGDEDDVLKTIEAGNTTLNIPNTRFVGYSARIQGLFGLKAEAQLGSLRFIGIASQEKGSSEGASVSATGGQNADYVRDYNYEEGRIFDLGYKGWLNPGDSITQLVVFEQETNDQNLEAQEAELMIDPRNPLYEPVWSGTYRFKRLEPDTYELLYGQDPDYSPIALVFHTRKTRRAMGVVMEVKRENGSVERFGNTGVDSTGASADTLMALMPPSTIYTPNHPTWQLMWRNVYRIPQDVKAEDIEVKIYKGLKGLEGTSSSQEFQIVSGRSQGTYLEILGLDQYNNTFDTLLTPDGLLDDRPEVFRPDLGLLIFPAREPFNSDTVFEQTGGTYSPVLNEKVEQIYNFSSTTEKLESSEYYVQIISQGRSAIVRLGRANIIEGSERVTANGRVLTKGSDYNIQYDFGQVTLLSDEATDPNADIQIDFQYAPFLSLQKKTLLGLRTEYDYSDDLKLGATVLYKSDKAQDRKPRVGQETSKALVMDFDVSLGLDPSFLTSAVDALPLINTEAESQFNITAEVAQSRPNPNVDGAAYIDDFESAVEQLSLGLPRTVWTRASIPVPIDTIATETWTRGEMRWHNPRALNRESIYAGETAAGEGSLTPLRLIFRPRPFVRAKTPEGCDPELVMPSRSWGGIMRSFSGIDEKRVQTFEIRAKGGRGILHFDFGWISEDIDGDGRNDTEDTVSANGTLDEGEDVGLDGIEDAEEVDYCGQTAAESGNPDPAGDDWWYEGEGKGRPYEGNENGAPPVPESWWTDTSPMSNGLTKKENVEGKQDNNGNFNDHWLRYEWQNGTEGNEREASRQGLPDEEAIGPGRSFEKNNSYFSFKLPLDPAGNEFVVEGSQNQDGWLTYRVPVRDPGILDSVIVDQGVEPDWANVTHVRCWFEMDSTIEDGVDSLGSIDSLWIADWGFIQSSWTDTLIRVDASDTTAKFLVASVSEENGTFSPPPGVEAYEDRVNNVTEQQRGLGLVYTNLPTDDEAIATKDMITTESYSGYRRMEMYVHGPEDIGTDSILFFLRFGRDSVNFYEYQTYLKSGWDEDNYVDIDFNELTALKDAADLNLQKSNSNERLDTVAVPYRVLGRPNINEVRFFSAGVINKSSHRVTGEVWLDELRVTDVRKDIGTAARVDVTGTMADLISYNFAYEHKDPYFRGLSQATRGGSTNNLGSGKENNSYSYGARLNLHKFLPPSWKASLPVSIGFTSTEEIPLLRTSSDVVLPDSVREKEKSTSESMKLSVSEKFGKTGSNLLFNVLLNRQKVSFSYNRSTRRSVNNPYVFAESYNIRAEYKMGIARDVSVPMFFWTKPLPILKKASESRFSFFPKTWNWSATFDRSLRSKDDQDLKRTSSFSRTLDGQMNMTHNIFPNLMVAYNFNTKRDLTDPDLVSLTLSDPKLGVENSYSQSLRSTYDPQLVSWLSGAFSYTATYQDTWDRTSRTRTTTLNKQWSVSGGFRHIDFLGGKRKSGGRRSAQPRRGGGGRSEEDSGSPFYEPVLAGMRFLTGWMNPLTYSYGETFKQSAPGAQVKPNWKYRMGFSTDIDFPIGNTNRNPSATENVNYEFGSGFSLLGGISTNVSYKMSTSRELVKVGSDRTESRSIGWPTLSLTIKKFTFLPLLKKPVNWFIGVFSPRTGYSRQVTETENLDRGFLNKKSETINRSPIIQVTLKVMRSMSFSGSLGESRTNDWTFDYSDGALRNRSKSIRKTITVSSKYSFSAPGGIRLPLFGRFKFKSQVTFDVSVKFNSNYKETLTPGKGWSVGTENSSFTVSPTVSYLFSQQIRGGLSGRWQDTKDETRNTNRHAREISIWTEIKF